MQSTQGTVRQSPGPDKHTLAHLACAVGQSVVVPSGHPPKVQKEPSPQWQKRVAWSMVHEGSVVVVVEVVVVVVVGQGPQSSVPPQPSAIIPQVAPAAAQVVGVQPQTFGVPPPPQVSGAVQVPQLTVPPQPSDTEPQLSPAGHIVLGVQPHTLAVPPPPHVCGAVQVPQVSMSPQSPSGIIPQVAPCAVQVVGVQQVPKSGFAFPGGEAGFMQSRLQQLMFV